MGNKMSMKCPEIPLQPEKAGNNIAVFASG